MRAAAGALSIYHRPRRRPMLRLVVACVALAIAAFTAGVLTWVRHNVVPPDCRNPDTLSLVRQSLTNHFHLPPSVTMDNIQTQAGGYVAFRFVCVAYLDHIDRASLPPGMPIPGSVHYTSQLSADHLHHEVHVSIEPLLIWVPVQ